MQKDLESIQRGKNMKLYTAENLKVDGSIITLDVEDVGTLSADFSSWESLIENMGGIEKVGEVKLLGDLLEFPNDVHVEIEDFINLAKSQGVKVSASLLNALKKMV